MSFLLIFIVIALIYYRSFKFFNGWGTTEYRLIAVILLPSHTFLFYINRLHISSWFISHSIIFGSFLIRMCLDTMSLFLKVYIFYEVLITVAIYLIVFIHNDIV